MRSIVIEILLVLSGASVLAAQDPPGLDAPEGRMEWKAVAGSGVHYFSSAVIHSTEPTPTGFVQRSTETVDLIGDLTGRIAYQPVSVFDFTAGTLVNTGHQVFSGTVLGSEPVLLHDDEFRFVVDLATGATVGEVYLVDRISGPRARCLLEIVGTGLTPTGDATFDYAGECKVRTGEPPGGREAARP